LSYDNILIRLSEEHINFVRGLIDEDCSITLAEIKIQLEAVCDLNVGTSTIAVAIKEFSYTLKRVRTPSVAANTPANEESRLAYSHWLMEMNVHQRNLFFVDESGFNIATRVSRGRAETGVTPVIEAPVQSRNITVIAVLTRSRFYYHTLDNHQPGNTNNFCHFIDDLANWRDEHNINNAMIVMDNVGFHRSQDVREMMEIRGFEYKYLPTYSPYFNPIENVFAQWKIFVKRAEPRSLQDIYTAMNKIGEILTVEQCGNYVRSCDINCLDYINGKREFEN
jgi:transposase